MQYHQLEHFLLSDEHYFTAAQITNHRFKTPMLTFTGYRRRAFDDEEIEKSQQCTRTANRTNTSRSISTDTTKTGPTSTDQTQTGPTESYSIDQLTSQHNKSPTRDIQHTTESVETLNNSTPIDHSNHSAPHKIPYRKRNKPLSIETKLNILRKRIHYLERKEQLTPREVSDYEEAKDLYEQIRQNSNEAHNYQLPSEYITEKGSIDRKRKQQLLKLGDTNSTSQDTFYEASEKRVKLENLWEKEQIKKASEIVSYNPDEIQVASLKDYEFVFDESQFVDFDEDSELSGEESDSSRIEPASEHVNSEISEMRKSLPAYKFRQEFLNIINENQVVIVVGETGSGKTTQLPQYLYEEGFQLRENGKALKIGCTQPRRVAATSVARRVATEVGCKVGQEVGYNIRFENVTSPKTVINYLTDGMLLREFLTDPLLSGYGALMIDEAHERTVSTEIVLTLLKDIIKERKDLKIIVASATINASKFSKYFDGAPVFNIPGRRFPVDISYTKHPEANYVQAAISTVFQIHTKVEDPGDILVFLTGQEEIESMEEALNEACAKLGNLIKNLIVAPIYANLPPAKQQMIFEPTPHGSRKVVLATNIAETSITIDGIKYVIDSGFVKENVFNPATGMDSLVVVPCSRASADQRAGRAGRVGPGRCFRLYTKWSFQNELQPNPTPEILRVNLCGVVLLLLSMGVTDLIHFDFMDPPSPQTLMRSLELLYALGALNARGQLTETGQKMAEFPMDPMFCKCLLASEEYGVVEEILSIIAMLSESSSLFYRPKDKKEQADRRKESFVHPLGDHFTLLNIWNQWRDTGYSNIWCEDNFLQYRALKKIKEVRIQLVGLSQKVGIETDVKEKSDKEKDLHDRTGSIQKSIFCGFFPNVARLLKMGTNYVQLKRKQAVHIHPSSRLFQMKPPPKFILYHELVLTSKEFMRNCIVVEEKWVTEMASHYYKPEDTKPKN